MKAKLRQIRISPKKANLVAALVRNKKVIEAIDTLKFTPKKAAPILRKLIESATANAENNFKQKRENLYIKEIIVTKGPTYKRSNPISRGRAHPILKRTAHITVKISTLENPKPIVTEKKTELKKEETKEKKKVDTKEIKSEEKNNN